LPDNGKSHDASLIGAQVSSEKAEGIDPNLYAELQSS
jgi:hypothetical protein